MSRVTARAPSSIANLGPGFDVFGLAVDAFHDEVALERTGGPTRIASGDGVPRGLRANTAGLVVSAMRRRFGVGDGVEITIRKGVPPGAGLGSSAASAAAAAVAFDALFGLGLGGEELAEIAGSGERASAGLAHYDNAAASVLGGFVAVRTGPFGAVRMDPPADLRMCVAIPRIAVPRAKTRASRGLVPGRVPLRDHVANLASASAMVAGFARKDTALICGSVRDAVAEPARRRTIPGFAGVRRRALEAGACGVAISGAGPSVVAFARGGGRLGRIGAAMSRGFAAAGAGCDVVRCGPAGGARARRGRGA